MVRYSSEDDLTDREFVLLLEGKSIVGKYPTTTVSKNNKYNYTQISSIR